MIENGYCTAADVDNFAKMAFGPRMCVTGVIEQKDLSGLVTHAASQRGTPAARLAACTRSRPKFCACSNHRVCSLWR